MRGTESSRRISPQRAVSFLPVNSTGIGVRNGFGKFDRISLQPRENFNIFGIDPAYRAKHVLNQAINGEKLAEIASSKG